MKMQISFYLITKEFFAHQKSHLAHLLSTATELSMLLRINFANEFFVFVMDTFTSGRLVVFKR